MPKQRRSLFGIVSGILLDLFLELLTWIAAGLGGFIGERLGKWLWKRYKAIRKRLRDRE